MTELFHQLLVAWFQFTLDWGYIGIIILMALESTAVPIPGEVVIPPAAYWAAQGKFNFWGVVFAGTLGSWIGSALSYWVAHWVGRPLVEKYGRFVFLSHEKLQIADRWFTDYGPAGIFLARLIPVIRHLISIPAGLCKMNFKTFSIATTVGAWIYCLFLAWFGQKFIGDQPELMNDPGVLVHVLKERFLYLGLGAIAAIALYIVYKKMSQGKRA